MTDKAFNVNLDSISKWLENDLSWRPALESFQDLRRQHRQATMFDIPELRRQVEAAKNNSEAYYARVTQQARELSDARNQIAMLEGELSQWRNKAEILEEENETLKTNLESEKASYQELRERLDREETRADGNFDAYEKAKAENVELMKLLSEDSNWKSAFEQEYKVSGERGREIFRLKAEIQELRLSRLIDGLEILKHTDKATYDLAVEKVYPLVGKWFNQLGASDATGD